MVIADAHHATTAKIALAWRLAQKLGIVPIPSTTKLSRLQENIGSVALELNQLELAEIEFAAAQIFEQGERYPQHLYNSVGK